MAAAYTVASVSRNRDTFISGRDEIVAFLTARWQHELDYALRKNLWTFAENRIAGGSAGPGRPSSAAGTLRSASSYS